MKEIKINLNKIRYCVTRPPSILVYDGAVYYSQLDLNARCGCGLQYKEHEEWKLEYQKQQEIHEK